MTNTTTTNESEAMEVWDKAYEGWDLKNSTSMDNHAADQAAARVIATAFKSLRDELEARDAELNDLRHWKLCAEEGLAERDARIAELEGALEVAAGWLTWAATANPGCRSEDGRALVHRRADDARAILTKGKTHD